MNLHNKVDVVWITKVPLMLKLEREFKQSFSKEIKSSKVEKLVNEFTWGYLYWLKDQLGLTKGFHLALQLSLARFDSYNHLQVKLQ